MSMLRLSSASLAFGILVLSALLAQVERTQKTGTELFVWSYKNVDSFGTIEVPGGFTVETENYREGFVTRLRYRDGSCIGLQRGGMWGEMFQGPEVIVDFSQQTPEKTIRRGHYKGKSGVWGEVHYKPHISDRRSHIHPIIEFFGPNIWYEHVPRKRAREFAQALESFRPSQ